MSHSVRQWSMFTPKHDQPQARLHRLQHDASVRQRLGRITTTAVQERARRGFIVSSDGDTDSSTSDALSLTSSKSSRKPSHHTTKQSRSQDQSPNTATTALQYLQSNTQHLWLKSGNSDPFSSFAIPINPEVNAILTFGRDVFLPTLSHTSGAKQSFIVNTNFQSSASALSSPGSALGLLSYLATAASLITGTPTWSAKALKYEVACSRVLRAHLAAAPVSQYPELITQILTLFGSAILTGRLPESRTHAHILQSLFAALPEPISVARLCFALYHARNLSAMFLVRSSFDVDGWVPEVITPIWKVLGAPFPHLNVIPEAKLDRSIASADPEFKTRITDVRNHYHTVVLTRERWSQEATPPDLVMYHVSHSVIYELRLIDHYLDITSPQSALGLSATDLWPQAYMCLATLYMAHSLLYSGLARLSDTTTHLKAALKSAILSAQSTSTLHSTHKYTNSLLWALFIGATAERIGNGASRDGSRWFNVRLKEQLLRMGITRWNDVRKVLGGFPCAGELVSQDTAWVEGMLRPRYEGDGTVRVQMPGAFRMYDGVTGGFD